MLELNGNQFSLQRLSFLTILKFTTSIKTEITFKTGVKKLRALTICTKFTLDSRYDKSIIKLIGNVYYPNTMCSDTLCVPKQTFQSLSISDFQCLPCESKCQEHNFSFVEQTKSLFLKFGQVIYNFEEAKAINSRCNWRIGVSYCPTCPNEMFVYFSTSRNSIFDYCKNAKPALTSWKLLLRTINRNLFPLVLMDILLCKKNESRLWKKEIHLHCWRKIFANHNQAHPNLPQKAQKNFIYGINLSAPHWLIQLTKDSFLSHFIHVQSTVKQNDFLFLQQRLRVVSRPWTGFRYSDCQRSPRPIYDNNFPRNSSGSLELVVVSQTKLFE